MIIDTSAIVAILRSEADSGIYAEAIERATAPRMSASTFLETAIVMDASEHRVPGRRFDELVQLSEISVEPFTAEQARLARDAYRKFGKGSGHRAKLNFGDCMAYALAKESNQPLLFKGDDFRHTDIVPALP